MEKIGITTTIPAEIVFASGNTPIDLNNIFIASNKSKEYVEYAEMYGYPRNSCAWIKGLYGVAVKENISKIIGVTEGDCSNTHALMETLKIENKTIIPFSYPYDRDRQTLTNQIQKLIDNFDTSWDKINEQKNIIDLVRRKLIYLDELTWKHNKATSFENHLWLVSSSDFNSDIEKFEKELDSGIIEIENRYESSLEKRIAYIGVPPIFKDFYDFIEENNSRVVFNEVQRQFSMPYLKEDIIDQYISYTYPYDIFCRLEDINLEIEKRNIDGVIHYTQSFCYRQIEDIILRKNIKKPILTIEGETPGNLDARTKLRLESFLEMI